MVSWPRLNGRPVAALRPSSVYAVAMKASCVAAMAFAAALTSVSARRPGQTGWIDLFNGKDLAGWHFRQPPGPNGWRVVNGEYVNTKPSTDIQTDREFYDFDLHVEFKVTPGDGNSGVYLRDKYEMHILDSFGRPASDHESGALYRRVAPSANAARPAGEWQTFDITMIGRKLTLIYNGQKVLDVADIGPKGTGAASERADGPGPLRLQGDHDSITFRNIRIRPH
jgi:Domain of Unknown Function (DUF1080)